MYKIAVIGAPDTVVGFKALGLEAYPVDGEDDARRVFRELTASEREDPCAIIYVEESLAPALSAQIDRFKDSPSPAVILIPGRDGPLGLGRSALQAEVERAVSANIL